VFIGGEKPHFYCGINGNGCGINGDVIDFVQQINGYASARQAIDELHTMGFPLQDTRQTINKQPKPDTPQTTSVQPERGQPCQQWQDRATRSSMPHNVTSGQR
jgi:hypothetical protein